MNDAQHRAMSRGITEPNSCGQGKHAQAEDVPCRLLIEREGWAYSHTTAIVLADGAYELHHTFRNGDHALSAWIDKRGEGGYWVGCWRWSGSWGGSGRCVMGLGGMSAVKYLKGVRQRMAAKDRRRVERERP